MFLSDIGKIKERGMLMFMARSYIDLLGSISDMAQGLYCLFPTVRLRLSSERVYFYCLIKEKYSVNFIIRVYLSYEIGNIHERDRALLPV